MRVLLIEDNPDHAVLIAELLSQIVEVEVELEHVGDLQAGISLLKSKHYDVILSDLDLPNSPIESTVRTLKTLRTETPIVILTALNSYEMASKLLLDGIQDYIPKDELSPSLLHRVCNHAIGRNKHQVELERRNRELQSFCESLTHDLKSPIVRIAQVAGVLREKHEENGNSSEDDSRMFDSIEQSTAVSLNLVDGLYNYLSVDYRAQDYNKIDSISLIEDVDSRIRVTTGMDYKLSVDDSLPALYGNRALLTLLFFNLVGNGIKYNRNNPEIEISGDIDQENHQSRICVQDNGIGIDEKFYAEIFKPFSRLHNSREFAGTGLGLGIVKRIVDCHEGSIDVNSQIDNGSIFTVSLPAYNS